MEQFGMSRQLRLPGQQKDRFWRAVVLCALTAAVFFLPFYIMDGGFFHYAGDFNSQQISFYRYMNGFLKGAGYPDSTFAGAPRNTFSWATDLGSGAMNAYSFYLYGSPFFWFSLLFPQRWLPYLMVPLLVLKFGVAGGGAYLYLKRYVKNWDYAVLGACLYALSGFAVYNVFFNHFVDVVALFPYLLWALDEAMYNKRHGLFAFWVAVNLLNNYFFFAGQVVFLAIYFVCKLTTGDYRLTVKRFVQLAFESLLGVAMGCLLLIPAVLSLLQNPRTIDLASGWGEGALALLIVDVVFGVVYGAYAMFWMAETLPRYYDENRICNFAQGAFHIHIPGVYYNNRNWKHILRAFRVWSMASLVLVPPCTAGAVLLERATGWQVLGAVLVAYIASLFGAIVIPAKRFE